MSKIIERFKNEEIAVHCKTESQAKEFIDICHDNDMKWSDEVKELNWEKYKEKTCYGYARIGKHLWYGTEWGFRDDVDKIITFDEFMEEYKGMKQFTKDDLKPGMLVEYRDGKLRLVMDSEDGLFLVAEGSHHTLTYYDDNLLDVECETKFDIVKVYDLVEHTTSNLSDLFKVNYRKLLWEREEVKELTVEEISKLLGYKVKVVGGKD